MKVNAALSQARIMNRVHQPVSPLKTLEALCKTHGLPYPVTTDFPVRYEITSGEGNIHFRNHPSRTYSLNLLEDDPLLVIELLAYYAFEWEAREIARKLN